MDRVFISYRRSDSDIAAGRLADDLSEIFGRDLIFRDLDTLKAGEDYVQALDLALESCAVLIVLIGPRWASVTDNLGRRRLDDPNDWVRLEIRRALERGIRVIPLLIATDMPGEADVPADLRPLLRRQSSGLSDRQWRQDIELLAQALEQIPGIVRLAPAAHRPAGLSRRQAVLASAALVTVAISAWWGWGTFVHEGPVPEADRQVEIDARALGIVERQLNPRPGSPPLSQQEINAAILTASPGIKVQILDRASGLRSQNWRDRDTKPIMERTIPVFRALVASDTEDANHGYHGQLGYSLKDRRQPEWSEAETELSKAIELRGPPQTGNWLFYEFNRAICRINLDQNFAHNRRSDAGSTSRILADLTAAATAPDVRDVIAGEPDINRWLALNKVKWPK